MPSADVNSISVLGHDLLLVEVGGGAETHLAVTDDPPTARAALADHRAPQRHASVATSDESMFARRWSPSTLCGRAWSEMAAGEDGPFRRWQEISLAPTCRSCLRVVDGWFPATEAPVGIGLLAWVVADTVEALGSAYITGVPAEQVEPVRRAARKYLRERGFRSQTSVVNSVVLVTSDDAYQSMDPALRRRWLDGAVAQVTTGAEPVDGQGDGVEEAIDWHTWVVEG